MFFCVFFKASLSNSPILGSQIGTVVGLPLTGLLIDTLGWESVFYVQGCIPFVWAIFWSFLVYESPEVHPRISEKEREYILKSTKPKSSKHQVRNKRAFWTYE